MGPSWCGLACSAARDDARQVIKRGVKLKVKPSLGLCLLQNKISPNPLLPGTPRVSFPTRLLSFNLQDVCFNFHLPTRPLCASRPWKSLRYKIPLGWFGDDKVQDVAPLRVWAPLRVCASLRAGEIMQWFSVCLLDRLENLRCLNLAETVADLPVRVLCVRAWVSECVIPLWTCLHFRVSGANLHLWTKDNHTPSVQVQRYTNAHKCAHYSSTLRDFRGTSANTILVVLARWFTLLLVRHLNWGWRELRR